MANRRFIEKPFSQINVDDPFFDSLKADYPENKATATGFISWFAKCSRLGRKAWIFEDDEGICAFIAMKPEAEVIEMEGSDLPVENRLKIATLKLAERYRGKRIGEGAMGIVLWYWQKEQAQEIYVTVFDDHQDLIGQLERFGFENAGYNKNHERVYIKNRSRIDYSDPYKSYPFVRPDFERCAILSIYDYYHDTMFPYSELANTSQEMVALNVANGVSKVYIGYGSEYACTENCPVFIYRIHNGENKKHKSCITSYCMVKNVVTIKKHGIAQKSLDEFKQIVRNKTVFQDDELETMYNTKNDLTVIVVLYYGYFGVGNNVNYAWLNENGYWPTCHPNYAVLSRQQFGEILERGRKNVQDVIID